ncbi:MAG: universal stress protein [Chloroflexota bacterium]
MPDLTMPALKLAPLVVDPRLAHRLPPDLVRRYHAIPITEDGGRVTVAMADPDDIEARQAIMAALGPSTYVVQADAQDINRWLTELWPEVSSRPLRLLTWASTDASWAEEITPYARGVATLLKASLDLFETAEKGCRAWQALAAESESGGYDLLIFGDYDQSMLQRLFSDSPECRLVEQTSASLLVTRRPRRVLEKILLVLWGQQCENDAAVDWIVRLARPSGALVTILPVIPSMPRPSNRAAAMQSSLPALLSTDTSLGRKIRRVARRLVDQRIESTLRLREEPPFWQVYGEVTEGDYDLVVIAAESHSHLLRYLKDEMDDPLLCWPRCPVLIAKPIEVETWISNSSSLS